jgi:hypothetical protein
MIVESECKNQAMDDHPYDVQAMDGHSYDVQDPLAEFDD